MEAEDNAPPVPNRYLITACLMTATLMQALDSTIANVALPYIQGSLSASYDQITWVLTSYVISAAVMTAPVGWLAARFGRKNLFIACLLGFTITSMLCGIAGSLNQIVIYRLIQGGFGAALAPLSQSTMVDIYPPRLRGSALSVWGMGVMVGPVLGPTLGGYLTAYYNWRFVFFVNLPFGIVAILGLLLLMPKDERAASTKRFVWSGFLMLAIGLCGMQLALDRGEELDWLSSGTIVTYMVLGGLGYYLFVVHMTTAKEPFFPRAVFQDRNFLAGLVMMFSVGLVAVASTVLLAPFLENIAGYPVATAGLTMAPRGGGTIVAMLVAGRLSDRVDPRLLLFLGYAMLGVSVFEQMHWTPDIPQFDIIWVLVLQGMSIGFIFIPVQVFAFYTLRTPLRTQGSSLLNLARNVGSAIGIAITSSVLDRQTQYEHAVLTQYVTPFARALQTGGAVTQMLAPGRPAGAALLNSIINTQAQTIGYEDDYKVLLLSLVPSMACMVLMRRPKAADTATAATAGAATAAAE